MRADGKTYVVKFLVPYRDGERASQKPQAATVAE
jgi:hypothetical protein